MSFKSIVESDQVEHATLVFQREVPATVDRVFDALANGGLRSEWGAPSDTATLIYDTESFIVGGESRFRCGSKANPNIHGTTRYLQIIPGSRIVSSETIDLDGRRLCASLTTLELSPHGNVTKLKSTTHVASFIGSEMIRGTEVGNNSSLDNLVRYFSAKTISD